MKPGSSRTSMIKRPFDSMDIPDSTPCKFTKLSSSPIQAFSPPKSAHCLRSVQPSPTGRQTLGIQTGPSAGGQAKKLVVKNVRSRPSFPPADFHSQSLATFTRSIRAITSVPPQPIPESLQTLYSLCEGCIPSTSTADTTLAQTLYDRIKMELERKVGDIKRTLSLQMPPADVETSSNTLEGWLRLVNDEWAAFCRQLGMIRSIFLHLDRTYVLAQKSLLGIWDLGLDIFRHKIVEDVDLAAMLSQAVLSLIARERASEVSSKHTFTSILSMLSSLSFSSYEQLFIRPYLEESAIFYQKEGENLLAVGLVPTGDYLRQVQRRLTEESDRADLAASTCLSITSRDKLGTVAQLVRADASLKGQILRVVETQLITNHVADLTAGLGDFVTAASTGLRDKSDLANLYSLLSRVGQLGALRTKLQQHVEVKGYALVADPAQDERMVESLLVFKHTYDDIVSGPFRADPDMAHALRAGYEVFVNKRQDKPAEMLAKFIDAKMRSGNKATADDELEKIFDEVLYLFRFTQAKDLFEAFYTRMFAKRLLLNKSASSDMEKIMLMKLQRECGAGFTQKLETMAKDIDLSSDLMTSYKQHKSNLDSEDPFDLSVSVLTTGHWPSFAASGVTIPSDMVQSLERFKRFYGSKYTGRVLSWQHSLDQCSMRANFPKGRKELSVSLFQAVIVLAFNEVEAGAKISFNDLLIQTKLDPKEAKRTLQSLACGKIRILTKHPRGKDVAETDDFSINEEFDDPRIRIKINQIQIKETVEEQKSTTDRVFVDRQNHVQLVIVRTLKSRKVMKHQELVMEVVSQLKNRFKVETAEIKKAISSLIDRDYMERGDSKDEYNYLA